jgi:hypothetical protein
MKKTAAFIIFLCATICCHAQSKGELSFRLPQLPDSLQTVEQRFHFVVDNYWGNFDFSDTLYVNARVTEEALVNYIDLLMRLPHAKGKEYMHKFLARTSAGVEMQNYMGELLRRYLVNYDSPMRNEKLYLCVAEYLGKNAIDITVKYNAIHDLSLLALNPEGAVAADFKYTLASGEHKRMHMLEAPYTLLLFYNPDCRSCSTIIGAVRESSIINGMLESGRLKLLAMCTQDDSPSWRRFVASSSAGWTNGYDKGMQLISEGIYDLRVLPVFYLLDSNKEILLKDVPLSKIEVYLK